MDTQITLESFLRNLITPIIHEAVEKALARRLDQPQAATSQQSFPDLMDIRMTAEFLHLSTASIYGLTHKREIPFYKRGKRLLFRRDELEKWIATSRRQTMDEIRTDALNSLTMGRRKN